MQNLVKCSCIILNIGRTSMHGDGDANSLIERYSGMVTEEQIARVIGSRQAAEVARPESAAERVGKSDAKAITDFMNSRRSEFQGGTAPAPDKKSYYADVEDVIYRIFNMTTFRTKDNREVDMRVVVLGPEGSTVRFVARGAMAGYVDTQGFERGDRVLIKDALIDTARSELKSISGTLITKLDGPGSQSLRVSDIDREMRNVDIVGKVASVYPVRRISRENGSSVAVSRITIADAESTIDASLWGSSALATAAIGANDYIKLEFCTVRERYGRLEVYANDLSRVLVNKDLESKARV